MFIINWLFDKLGYMPKIDMEVGKINLKIEDAWPFPVVEVKSLAEKPKKKVIVPKATTKAKKPAVAAKAARKKVK
jgi:hypothetical protein